jgi:hypothetical protein
MIPVAVSGTFTGTWRYQRSRSPARWRRSNTACRIAPRSAYSAHTSISPLPSGPGRPAGRPAMRSSRLSVPWSMSAASAWHDRPRADDRVPRRSAGRGCPGSPDRAAACGPLWFSPQKTITPSADRRVQCPPFPHARGRVRRVDRDPPRVLPVPDTSPRRAVRNLRRCLIRGRSGPKRAAHRRSEPDLAWHAFPRRFDIEHTFRMLEQTLGWTRPKLREPESADCWTWLVIAAHTQLRLARPMAKDLRRPWEKPTEPARLTPARVRRGFRNLRATIPPVARAPKPSAPGPGRPSGSKNKHTAARYDVGLELVGHGPCQAPAHHKKGAKPRRKD